MPGDAHAEDSPSSDGSAPEGAKSASRGCGWGCLGVVAFIAIAFAGCTAISAMGGSSRDTDTEYEAIAQCEARIEELLKSPATAEFNSDATKSGAWTVTGTVDAENSFGGTVRMEYQCTVEIDGDTATTSVDYLNE